MSEELHFWGLTLVVLILLVVVIGAAVSLAGPHVTLDVEPWVLIGVIVAGVLLVGVEMVILPGTFFFGIAGLLLMGAGLLGLLLPVGALTGPRTLAGEGALAGVVGMSLILLYLAGRQIVRMPTIRRIALGEYDGRPIEGDDVISGMRLDQQGTLQRGMTGVALTPLRPAGRVKFGERLADVVTAGEYIDAGAMVRIAQISGFSIVVEPMQRMGSKRPAAESAS